MVKACENEVGKQLKQSPRSYSYGIAPVTAPQGLQPSEVDDRDPDDPLRLDLRTELNLGKASGWPPWKEWRRFPYGKMTQHDPTKMSSYVLIESNRRFYEMHEMTNYIQLLYIQPWKPWKRELSRSWVAAAICTKASCVALDQIRCWRKRGN